MSVQTPNQFAQSVTKGQVDARHLGGSALPVEVDASQATPLVPGQCVKIVDSAGGVPKVVASAAATDDVLGVVAYDLRRPTLAAGQDLEILTDGAVVYMEASGAIARGARVMEVIAGSKVAPVSTGNMTIGRALDKAAAAGDLIRVRLMLTGILAP